MNGYARLLVLSCIGAIAVGTLSPVVSGEGKAHERRQHHHAHPHPKGHHPKRGHHHHKHRRLSTRHFADTWSVHGRDPFPPLPAIQDVEGGTRGLDALRASPQRSDRRRRDEDPTTSAVPSVIVSSELDSTTKKGHEGPSTSTPSLDMACTTTSDCTNITNSICHETKKTCLCDANVPVLISSIQECVRSASLNATCEYDKQCSHAEEFSICDSARKICSCISGYEMKEYPDVGVNCVMKSDKRGGSHVDPTMIAVLAALAVMFIIICVVLRLFSKARFRENRSIFNTPNPRLMNASLFKDSKLLSPARGDRRGSRASVRGPPSRAPSITSVNKDGAGRSPNGSLAKGRRGSTLSTASATGSAAAPPSAKTPSPSAEEKHPTETTVAIEPVD